VKYAPFEIVIVDTKSLQFELFIISGFFVYMPNIANNLIDIFVNMSGPFYITLFLKAALSMDLANK
jgi:hypothetical protein